MDIKESDQDYFLEAELPGLSREDFTLKLDQGVLTLKGERKRPTTDGSEKDLRLERSYGSFTRKFSLPAEVESDAIKAEFKQGLLRVRVPKKSKPQPQEIDVDVMP
jgi:HSP20 family protein